MRQTSYHTHTVLLLYDWLINIDEELVHIWRHPRRRKTASVIYLLTRHVNILSNVLEVATMVIASFVSLALQHVTVMTY